MPSAGTVDRGTTVRIGYYDQLGRDLDPAQRVRDAVAGDKGEPSLADVTLMRRFWFDGDAHDTPVYDRTTLPAGFRLTGPAVVEQVDCACVLMAPVVELTTFSVHAPRPKNFAGLMGAEDTK